MKYVSDNLTESSTISHAFCTVLFDTHKSKKVVYSRNLLNAVTIGLSTNLVGNIDIIHLDREYHICIDI